MEFIRTIIRDHHDGSETLTFELCLDKSDWLLLNQTPGLPLSLRFELDKDAVIETSENVQLADRPPGQVVLTVTYDLDSFMGSSEEDGDWRWTSMPVTIKVNGHQCNIGDIHDSFVDQLQKAMAKKKRRVQNDDESCWREPVPIDY
jgi:hypothetical protein